MGGNPQICGWARRGSLCRRKTTGSNRSRPSLFSRAAPDPARPRCAADEDGRRDPDREAASRAGRADAGGGRLALIRSRSGDENFGHICPFCAGPKYEQSLRCWSCWSELRRGSDYWTRRTCSDCGGPTAGYGERCRPCAVRSRRPGWGERVQLQDHPWRTRPAA
jgi:hypothetical protein